ncbi:MAG: ABC transporter permease, partial [Longimicrobiales bacterium]
MARLEGSSLWQLTLMRIREFTREPEAIFWTFFFPVIMAIALGLAFRESDPSPVPVAVVGDPAEVAALAGALDDASALDARVLDAVAAERALAGGDVALLVVPGDDGAVTYRYDPTRAEAR